MSFTPEQRYFADTLFKMRILQSVGQAYQDLFTQVMGLRDSSFRPIKTQGKLGDRKNDGYHANSGRYFQVYSPEHHDSADLSATITKIQTDFSGLKAYWDTMCPVTEFRFAINDRFQGTYPSVEKALLDLKKEHSLAECSPFLAKDLMHEFGQLV